ncbi:hypothetical protein D0C36_03140 [Mucilaginibacter conchicola]|uniref:Tetratricopeptide repeat protein n=1 Tax=Mucilaginibacter conchicola TaxID=2303333 RepID=A0A372NWR5_9SPHI|nr:hypothetical protein [Mucilaginibacter conchicola]RFZ94556.1 hypothetical protein D0C36_03140 [Mucilaginibacter conchicola]
MATASGRQDIAVPQRQRAINKDTLTDILIQKEAIPRQKRLIIFVKNNIQISEDGKLNAVQDTLSQYFDRYNFPDKDIFMLFAKSMSFNKLHDLKQAEIAMTKAVREAERKKEDYLMFQLLSHLGFIQTDEGDYIGAIYNYRLATIRVRKLRATFKDNRREASLDNNISDLYYKTGLYAESLNYLNKARKLLADDTIGRRMLASVILYNICENYFRMGNLDSLKAYHKKLYAAENRNYKLFTYQQRVGYYISLLQHRYDVAIQQIRDLKAHKQYAASDLEDQRLADAFYQSGQLDSAQIIVNRLLNANGEANHPEVKQHLYELLGQIAERKDGISFAAANFKKALAEAREYNTKLTQVGSILSQIKLDETESSYNQRTAIYERERLWLMFVVIVAALIIVAIALIYRNVTQKRHYEKLLFAAKKEELAFINSHEVRKHLTNILGIIDILKNSSNKPEDYEQVEPYLQESAAKLDEAIKNISEKLND